jgi:PGF-CTERM protein
MPVDSDRCRVGVALALAIALVVVPVAALPASGQSEDTVTLTVSVVTDRGTPVGGAAVEASWDGDSTRATTAGNGKVFVDVPAGATVSLDVRHEGYTRNFPFRATVREDRVVTVEVRPAVTFAYAVSDADGDAVADARVTVLDTAERVVARGTTDANGRYATGPLEAGTYRVRFERAGFYNHTRTEEATQDRTRRVTLKRGTVALTVAVSDPHFEPPRPVANATVNGSGLGSVRTDDGGTAVLDAPVNSQVEVAVEKEGYRSTTRSLAVGEAARRANVSVGRAPNLTLVATNSRVVVGESVLVEVRDAYDDPAGNVTVLRDGDPVGTTDGAGELAVPVGTAGPHELRARGRGTSSNRVTVEGVTAADATTGNGTDTGTGTTGSLAPGFGALAAVVALLAVGLLARYADSRR